MAIAYAYVRYLDDNEREIVPINRIKHFKPNHLDDFIKSGAYMVKWKSTEEGRGQFEDEDHDDEDTCNYKAQILMLGGRCSRPKLSLCR